MPRALTADDATVLKLTLFALLERYSAFKRSDLDEMNDFTPTPSGPVDETMEAVNRVRIDGKAVVRTEQSTDNGEPFYELHYPFSEDDFPGGARTICLALALRMQQPGGNAGTRGRARWTDRRRCRPGDRRPACRVNRNRRAGRTHALIVRAERHASPAVTERRRPGETQTREDDDHRAVRYRRCC